MCKRKWRRVFAASLLSMTMLCTVIPEVSYAAVPAEESEDAKATEKKEKSAEAIDSTGRAAWDEVNVANAIEIQEDKIHVVDIQEEGNYQVFKFVPTETREYTFYSEGSYDTYGMLKNEDGSVTFENDDRDSDENFSITEELTAGETYYCMAQMLNSDDIGSFICMISSTKSSLILSEDNVKTFEITEYYNDTEYYRYENSVEDIPLGGYDYRITFTDDQSIEGYLYRNRYTIYGAYVSVRFKNETEEGIADTTEDTNALIYSIAGVDAAEIPITYIDSPVESMSVLENPWTTVIRDNEYDILENWTGLKIQINYTNGETKTAVGDYEEWHIQEDEDWVYPGCSWKSYDEYGELTVGQNAVIFTYLGASVEVPVTVTDIGVQNISIVRNPEKMQYFLFENTVDLFGLTLRIVYTDGTSEQVSVTEHGRTFKVGKYNISLNGSFQYDDYDNKTGVRITCSGSSAAYKPTFQTYASVLGTAANILPGSAVSVSLNTSTTYRIFRFVPLDTKEYEIKSDGNFDTYVMLLDANGNWLETNDDGGTDGNFALTSRLEAGKTYYYFVRMYDVGESGTFSVTLSGGTAYTITYNLNGGTNNASNPAAYYSTAVVLKNPARPQYTFEGWYTDSAYKNKITQIPAGARQNYVLYAKWQKVKAPGKAKLTSASNSKSKKIAVKYKKVKNVAGYEISYATNKKFKKASSITTQKTKAAIGKLKKGKTYYVRVCAYNLDSTGQKIRGKWSSSKKVTVKK